MKQVKYIDYCLTHNAKLVIGVDTNLLNIETMKERFLQMKNVEIAFWDSIIYPRWIEKYDYLYGRFMRFE